MEESRKIKLTIFTPVYNRAHTVNRLYESLRRQRCFDFEWLIIDDGSSDNIRETVGNFVSNCFPIRFFRKENGGKHTAYNTAVEAARGEYFMCVDSDDILADNAVIDIINFTVGLPAKCGIAAYKTDFCGNMLGSEFPKNTEETTTYELSEKLGGGGEYTYIYPTDIVRQVPFPVFEGERFVTESVVYDRLDKICKIRFLPRIITICEYQPDGYSASVNKIMKNNPIGYSLYFMQRIDLVTGFRQRLVYAGKYHAFRIFSPTKLRYDGLHKIFVALCRPVGWLFLLYYKLFRGF